MTMHHRPPTPHRRRLALGLTVASTCLSGCGNYFTYVFAPDGASVQIQGLGPKPAALTAELPHGSYMVTPSEYSLYASDLPLETILAGGVQNGQFLHAQLLWIPKPGMTPIDETATNVVLRYVIVSDGKVGVYGGAGFAWPRGDLGVSDMSLVVEGSSLALLAANEGFVDPLTPANLTGTFVAPFNEEKTQRFRRGISQIVTDAFEVSRWVDGSKRPISPDQVLALFAPAPGSPSMPASAPSTAGSTGSRSGS